MAGIQFGPFHIDVEERMLRRDGELVPLTPKAFDLLVALIEKPGQLVLKEQLLQKVWPDTFVEESNLAYNIFALRKALGDSAEDSRYIETVAKKGYRFKATIRPGSGPGNAPVPAADAGPGRPPFAAAPRHEEVTVLPFRQGLTRSRAALDLKPDTHDPTVERTVLPDGLPPGAPLAGSGCGSPLRRSWSPQVSSSSSRGGRRPTSRRRAASL